MKTAFYNGIVYTGELPFQEAFLVEDGLFGDAGSDSEVLSLLHPGDERVDLEGRFVCAGFNDSHMHLLNFGQVLHGAKLAEHTASLQEMLSYLRIYLKETPPRPGQWLKGRGWNQDYFTDVNRMPNRQDLDSVSVEVPIMITRTCGHSCAVNSLVLELDLEGGQLSKSSL